MSFLQSLQVILYAQTSGRSGPLCIKTTHINNTPEGLKKRSSLERVAAHTDRKASNKHIYVLGERIWARQTMIHRSLHGEVSSLIDLRVCFALLCLLELLNWLLSERQRAGECMDEGSGDEESVWGKQVMKAGGRRGRKEVRAGEEVHRINSQSQMERPTPALHFMKGRCLQRRERAFGSVALTWQD